jgi:hypothetical protein
VSPEKCICGHTMQKVRVHVGGWFHVWQWVCPHCQKYQLDALKKKREGNDANVS